MIQCDRNDPQKFGKGAGEVVNRRMSEEYLNYNVVKICQNTEKSPRDLRILAVTRTSMRDPRWCEKLTRVIIIVRLATVVEGDPKAPFSIATTPGCALFL